MTAVARGFCSHTPRAGVSIGIVPGEYPDGDWRKPLVRREPYPNPFVEIPIYSHLPASAGPRYEDKASLRSRNHLTALSADLVIAVGGSTGTQTEVDIALAQGRTVIFLGARADWQRVLPTIRFAPTVEALAELLR